MDYDALKALVRTARLILDPQGQQMDIKPDTIVVRRGSPNEFRLREILGATSIPGSDENDANAMKEAFKILPLSYLTADAPWAAFDSSMKGREYGFQLKIKEDINLWPADVVYSTGEVRWKGTMLYDYGHNDARNWVFSTGANA